MANNKAVGLDIGYANVKMLADGGVSALIPSLIGTPEKSSFKLVGADNFIVVRGPDGKYHNVGLGAIEQSRFTSRQEDRSWIQSDDYQILLAAALAQIPAGVPLTVVSGLPVAFYAQDASVLETLLKKSHVVDIEGRGPLTYTIDRVRVIPQGMGVVLDAGLNEAGDIANPMIATGHVGVIDIGGKTTNLVSARKMGDVAPETESINTGGWDAVRAIAGPLQALTPGVDYKDHEIADAIVAGQVNFRGTPVSLGKIIEEVLDPMAAEIVAKARQLWQGSGAKLDAILLAGGGSLLLSSRIMKMFDHANIQLVNEPLNANVRGYYKLAVRANKVG